MNARARTNRTTKGMVARLERFARTVIREQYVERPITLVEALRPEPGIITRRFALFLSDRWRRRFRGDGSGDARELAWFPLVLVASVPVGLDVCLRLVGEGSSLRALVWMVLGAMVLSLMLFSGPWAWEQIEQLAGPIDSMLDISVAYVRAVSNRLRRLSRWNYALCPLVAIGAVVGTYVVSKYLAGNTFGPAFYVSIAALGFFGWDAAIWMCGLTFVLVQPLTKVVRLRVVMHSPATTRAIREMAQFFEYAAFRASVGVFLLGLMLWDVSSVGSRHGHGISQAAKIGLLGLGPLILSIAVLIYVAFIPNLWLSKAVGAQRDRMLDELAEELPDGGPMDLLAMDTQKVTELYDSLAVVDTATPEARVVARRVVAVILVLLPQLLVIGSKLLHLS